MGEKVMRVLASLGLLVALAVVVLPQNVSAAFPDNALERLKAAIVATDTVNCGDGCPAMRSLESGYDTGTLVSVSGVDSSATQSSVDQYSVGRGLWCVYNATVPAAATLSITPSIQVKDQGSATYFTYYSGPVRTASGALQMTLYPGAASTAAGTSNPLSTNLPLPHTYRLQTAGSIASTASYTFGCSNIP